jgi:hypothetical protein
MRLPTTSTSASTISLSSGSWPITTTVPGAMQISGLGESKIREMIRDGTLETIVIGGRRLVVVASYLKLVEAELAGPPKDARRNRVVPALGSYLDPNRNNFLPAAKRRGRPRKHPPTVAAV